MINQLVNAWNEAGIHEGDTVLIHSNISRLFKTFLKQKVRLSPEDILTSFKSAVGQSGTLVFPLFNFDFTQSVPFDMRTTPSHMGALTEAARLDKAAIRTGHPIYSFVAIGHHAERFQNVNNFSGYGADSPFAILKQLGGKIAVLDLPDQHSMTFYHYVEEMNNVPYRYHKKFQGQYTTLEGITENREYGLFVRNIEQGVLTHVNPMGERLWEEKLYQGDKPGEGMGLRTVDANQLYDYVENIIASGKALGLLYKTN